ncbi:MAG: hypothetical protein IPK50_14600 [Fibrobacterota bacterium]|nr:MAG: hypothetical protein IPK50_14600 [Fibrobacterota bacterium]
MSLDRTCCQCGGDVFAKIEHSVEGLYCRCCGWNVVTTYIPESVRENQVHEFKLTGIQGHNFNQISVIAKLLGVGFLEAKKAIGTDGSVVVQLGVIEFSEQIANLIRWDIIVVIPQTCKWIQKP